VAAVNLSGNVTAYAIHMGHNLNTQRGEEALNFIVALYMFSQDRCLQGLGRQPYQPIPLLGGQHANPPAPNNEPGHGPQPDVQAAAGNAGPEAAAPPVVDPDEEVADDMLNVIMLD
jgi:hypothetical protein